MSVISFYKAGYIANGFGGLGVSNSTESTRVRQDAEVYWPNPGILLRSGRETSVGSLLRREPYHVSSICNSLEGSAERRDCQPSMGSSSVPPVRRASPCHHWPAFTCTTCKGDLCYYNVLGMLILMYVASGHAPVET